MKQQADGSARLIRASMFAIHVVGKKHGLDLFGLVIVIEKFTETSGEKGNELRDFLAGDAAEFSSHPKQVRPAAHTAGVDFRRRFHEERLQVARQFLELVVY